VRRDDVRRPAAVLLSLVALLCARPALAQDGAPAAEQGPPPGTMCVVMPEEEVDPEIWVEYKGRRVYLCCDKCVRKFKRDPELYMSRLVSGEPASGTPGGTQPAPGARVEQGEERTPAVDAARGHEERSAAGPSKAPTGIREAPCNEPKFFKWLGNFHPAATDLPVGAIVGACVAEVMFLVRRKPGFAEAARFCVWFAALTGMMAAGLGWCFGGFRLVDKNTLLLVHRWLGTGSALWMLVLLVVRERAGAGGAYRGMLFLGTGLVGVTGFFGGAMAYGIEHYLWK
jgi:YHS domain-containing protein/uncharacterized membrane protein